MTPGEWQEIIVETEKRWPNQWTPSQAVAYYADLREFEPVDVWAAWHSLNDSGREFPPNGSLLRSKALEERRNSARQERWARPQLVNPDGTVSWATYAREVYGGLVGLEEAIRIEHEKFEGCLSPICDIHTKEKTR